MRLARSRVRVRERAFPALFGQVRAPISHSADCVAKVRAANRTDGFVWFGLVSFRFVLDRSDSIHKTELAQWIGGQRADKHAQARAHAGKQINNILVRYESHRTRPNRRPQAGRTAERIEAQVHI